MAGVLAVLAVLSVVGGYLGLPHLWHLPTVIEHWLAPVFAGSIPLVASAGYGKGAAWGLMIFSIIVAFSGFLAARYLYKDAANPLPGRLLASPNRWIRGIHRVVFNKYYVDEAYDATVIRGTLAAARGLSWWDGRIIDALVNFVGVLGRWVSNIGGAIDRIFVDGAVEVVGKLVQAGGRAARRTQPGRIQGYVQGLVLGALAVVVLAYLLAW
jgi:NADH:ubiquinone oxidoreductase subunit 5 (subunit L)/multisubunit Na+/H+ antiporter MnhA subunit